MKYIYLHAQIFRSTCIYFSCITMAGEQVETWENYFTERPVLVDQATLHLHLHSSNLNFLAILMILLMCLIYFLADGNS